MRLASWVSCAISLIVCGAQAADSPSPADSMQITAAEFALTTPGQPRQPASRELHALPDVDWTIVRLPHVMPRQMLTQPASEQDLIRDSVTAWYRIEVPRERIALEPSGIYLPRWNTWGSLAVYVGGSLVYSSVDAGALPGFNQPLLVRIPAGLEATPAVPIVIRVDSPRVIGSVVSTVWIGAFEELQQKVAVRRMMQTRVPELSAAIMLSLGLFAFCFWLIRRHETGFLFFFLITALYFLRHLRLFAADWPLSEQWFGWIVVHSQGFIPVLA